MCITVRFYEGKILAKIVFCCSNAVQTLTITTENNFSCLGLANFLQMYSVGGKEVARTCGVYVWLELRSAV